jgi:hypothetical protein
LRFEGADLLPLEPSRELGADNVRVYEGWLGLGAEERRRLELDQVI